MKKHSDWIRFAMFCVVLIFMLAAINFVPKELRARSSNYWRYLYNTSDHDDFDIVFLGNSHAQVGIIPEVVDDVLNTQSISLITPGASILKTEHEVYEVVDILQPDLILLETAPLYGGRLQTEWPEDFFSMYDLMPLSIKKMKYVFADLSPENSFRYLFPVYDKHTIWKSPERIFKDISLALSGKGSKSTLKNQGYLQLTELMSPLEAMPTDDFINNNECKTGEENARINGLERILVLGDQSKTQIALFEMPVLNKPEVTCNQYYLDKYRKLNGAYFEILSDSQLPLLWFRDVYHTSHFGALQATLNMIQYLADDYGYIIDGRKLEKYESLLFEDIEIEQEEGNVLIKLIPDQLRQSNDVFVSWALSKDGKEKYIKEDWNLFSVDLPLETGINSIHFSVTNTEVEYTIEGAIEIAE